jgi:hypothetical protein
MIHIEMQSFTFNKQAVNIVVFDYIYMVVGYWREVKGEYRHARRTDKTIRRKATLASTYLLS